MHEAQMHQENSYLTLTYADEHLPSPPSVNPRVLAEFMKNLRDRMGSGIRFYGCGEYGEKLGRPHYHVILFGADFSDKKFYKWENGNALYTSAKLDKIWKKGRCWIGNVTQSSAGYVARYVLKKQTGEQAPEHYQWTAPDGHKYDLHPEFNQMSRGSKKLKTGGIGKSWYEKFGETDCHNQDFVVGQNGREYPVPAYYDKLLGKKKPARLAAIKRARAELAKKDQANNTSRRLHDREIIQKAKASRLTRKYEKS